MRKTKTAKNVVLVFCLFTFLLIVLGGGLRLNPGGALLAAATGTPLLIYVFQRLMIRTASCTECGDESNASLGAASVINRE
jgi:hypothetical protein